MNHINLFISTRSHLQNHWIKKYNNYLHKDNNKKLIQEGIYPQNKNIEKRPKGFFHRHRTKAKTFSWLWQSLFALWFFQSTARSHILKVTKRKLFISSFFYFTTQKARHCKDLFFFFSKTNLMRSDLKKLFLWLCN